MELTGKCKEDFENWFMIESIVKEDESNVIPGGVSKLRFRVKWRGYDSSEDTYESWKTLKNTLQLRRFLENHSKEVYRKLLKRLPRNVESHDVG